jgi:ABC-type multidrug transport system fused ATPase/permease subunit
VINDSELVESGTHQALLAGGKLYAELYKMQSGDGSPETPAPVPANT